MPKTKSDRYLVAIPVFNEEPFLDSLLSAIRKRFSWLDILVIDDGSTDQSLKIIKKHQVFTIHHLCNLGKGTALASAFRFARVHGYDWIITMDGDWQHDPKFLSFFFESIRDESCDVVIGNRIDRQKRMPWPRQLSNGMTSIVVSLLAGNQRIYDSQCGYRAYRVQCIPLSLLKEPGFQAESEILLRMGKMNCRVAHVAIDTRYGSETSSIHPVFDTCRFLILVSKSFFW
ncbi:glycosyltransferase [candidate division KSB1 bacterium]|jgi:glycosyltransferase involved in cell wall biosynthesis|nr:glycosyltransferase [candidate division KSB1 bacterium]